MEKSKLPTREELKTYFQLGDYPTQSEFAELIDSFRHKDDTPSYKDIVNIANRLETLDSRTIQYYSYGTGDLKFPIVISQKDAEDFIIEVKNNSEGMSKTQKIFGNAPFIITAKEFPLEILGTNEYYILNYYSYDSNRGFSESQRLFGNNLPTIPDGFEVGTMEGEQSSFGIYKQDIGEKVHILNTNIQFINKTEADIQYKASSMYWSSIYTNKDMITDHYNISDYLNFMFNADLRNIEKPIECKIYSTHDEKLLMTTYLSAEQNNLAVWGGGQADVIRNIRIECDY